jgi:signal transduction histidine kinase
VIWWTAFGLMSAVQYRQMAAAAGRPVDLSTALVPSMASAWLWIPATWLALVLAQRAPIGAADWKRPLSVHAAATLVVVLFRAIAVVALNPWIGWYQTLPSYAAVFVTSVQNNVFFYWMVLAAAHAVHYARNARLRESQLADARLRALTAQLQPHFLFNALNTVASLVHENPDAAERVVVRLSALMRQTTDTTGELVPLHEELNLLSNYLEIEQARFEDRLQIRWSVGADATSALVPHLILQPIVENSIVHGFRPVARPVTIDIRIARDNKVLEIVVADTGAGYDATLARDGVGLRNTRERLNAVFRGDYSLDIDGQPGVGARVRLRLPFREGDGGNSSSTSPAVPPGGVGPRP